MAWGKATLLFGQRFYFLLGSSLKRSFGIIWGPENTFIWKEHLFSDPLKSHGTFPARHRFCWLNFSASSSQVDLSLCPVALTYLGFMFNVPPDSCQVLLVLEQGADSKNVPWGHCLLLSPHYSTSMLALRMMFSEKESSLSSDHSLRRLTLHFLSCLLQQGRGSKFCHERTLQDKWSLSRSEEKYFTVPPGFP